MADQNAARALSEDTQPAAENVSQAPPPPSRGAPSSQLQQSGLIAGEDLEEQPYETMTEAASEQGIFQLVGGYLDDQGVVHNEIHVRSMTGEEEDLLGNRGIPILDRVNTIIKSCTKRLGTLTEPGQISQAIERLPLAARTQVVIYVRRVTHWKKTKDQFDMEVRCPFDACQTLGSYAVNLAELEVSEMPHPEEREHNVTLSSGEVVRWRVAAFAQEKVLSLVANMDETASLTYSILVRLVSIGDKEARLGIGDLLTSDHKRIRMSKRASELFTWARKLSSGDRDLLRQSFLDEEPDINTSITITCSHCHKDFEASLGIGQETFWFPSSTSKRLKMKSST